MGTSSSQDFSAVYSRWMPSLTRYCRTILRSDADAEDAAQNAMLKAMDALATGPAPDQLTPWLHRIARNEAISLMRRRRGDAELLELHHEAGPAPEEVIGTRDRLAQLVADVQALPERQRQALVLRELDGMPYRQIATALSVTEGAAQQAVLDARRSMAECENGRLLECDSVQGWLNAHEHALVRGRKVRAHLRACSGCRSFAVGLGTRPRELALLLPMGSSGIGLLARLASAFAGGGALAGKIVLSAGLLTAGIGLGEMVVQPGSGTDASAEAASGRPANVVRAAAASTLTRAGAARVLSPAANGAGAGAARTTVRATRIAARAVSSGRFTTHAGTISSSAGPAAAGSAAKRPAAGSSRPSVATPSSSPAGAHHDAPAPVRKPTASAPSSSRFPAPLAGTPAEHVPSPPAAAPVVAAVAPVVEPVTAATEPVVKAVTDTGATTTGTANQTTTTVTQTVSGVTGKLLGGG